MLRRRVLLYSTPRCNISDNYCFFDNIINQRSILLDPETALEGATTLSLETQADLTEGTILSYIEENFVEFLNNLRFLSKQDQELLLCYYIVAKTQKTLAIIHSSTQTLCSARLRMAMKKMGTFIMMGPPTADVMEEYLDHLPLSVDLGCSLSNVVELYAKTRSFQRVAEVLSLHRPNIRRAMAEASKLLLDSKPIRENALGAYIHDLIDKASASGHGFSDRQMAKQGNIYMKDPEILGEFRIDVTNPSFNYTLISRANR
jgi:hypothetical protein